MLRPDAICKSFPSLLVIDWVIRRTVDRAGTDIRWKITTSLEGLIQRRRLGSHLKQIHTDSEGLPPGQK